MIKFTECRWYSKFAVIYPSEVVAWSRGNSRRVAILQPAALLGPLSEREKGPPEGPREGSRAPQGSEDRAGQGWAVVALSGM